MASYRTHIRIARQRVVGTAVALVLVVSACSDDDPIATPITGAMATPTSTARPISTTSTTALTDAPGALGADLAPESSDGAAEPGGGSFNGEMIWSEVLGRVSFAEQACIRGALDEAELESDAGGSPWTAYSVGLLYCLGDLIAAQIAAVSASLDDHSQTDDHADSIRGATAAAVGAPVKGILEYAFDTDFFVFDAVEGEAYEIAVAPGTLEDPTVTLYDADGLWLDDDDDSGGSLAPLLFWSADTSGPIYVEVGGYGAGSYT